MTYEVKSLNEECGVFGIWGHPQAAHVTYFGLHSLQHRGQEGAGIVTSDNGKLLQHRNTGLLSDVFKNPADLEKLTGTELFVTFVTRPLAQHLLTISNLSFTTLQMNNLVFATMVI